MAFSSPSLLPLTPLEPPRYRSYGVLLYEMASGGDTPYKHLQVQEVLQAISSGMPGGKQDSNCDGCSARLHVTSGYRLTVPALGDGDPVFSELVQVAWSGPRAGGVRSHSLFLGPPAAGLPNNAGFGSQRGVRRLNSWYKSS